MDAKRLNKRVILEIIGVICFKLACLTMIWFAFFNTDTRVEQSAESVGNALLFPSTSNKQVDM